MIFDGGCGQIVFLLMKAGRLMWGWVGMIFVEEVWSKKNIFMKVGRLM